MSATQQTLTGPSPAQQASSATSPPPTPLSPGSLAGPQPLQAQGQQQTTQADPPGVIAGWKLLVGGKGEADQRGVLPRENGGVEGREWAERQRAEDVAEEGTLERPLRAVRVIRMHRPRGFDG